MRYGYARVSTEEQDTRQQIESLTQAGCEVIKHEKASGGRWDRPVLQKLLDAMVSGDTLVVHALDRLSRSTQDLLMLLDQLNARGIEFKSITQPIDTTTAEGKAFIGVLAVFAEFERSMIKKRVTEGVRAAVVRRKASGQSWGRVEKLNSFQKDEIIRLISNDLKTQADCARLFKVSRPTVAKVVARYKESLAAAEAVDSPLFKGGLLAATL